MKRKLIILLLLTALGSSITFAEEVQNHSGISSDVNRQVRLERFAEVIGDVISIGPSDIMIFINGDNLYFKLDPKVLIYCNGLRASWKALLPVAPEAYFEARVVVNKSNEAICVDGYYYGEESIINGWSGEKGNLILELKSINSQKTKQYVIKRTALLPKVNWLVMGQVVYVLYNREGMIRAVYLPD